MKLKQVVVALVSLGLVSTGALAAKQVHSHSIDAAAANNAKLEAALEQNQAANTPTNLAHDWFSRINVSGQANIDSMIANRVPTSLNTTVVDVSFILCVAGCKNGEPVFRDVTVPGTHGVASDIALANANLFVDANINTWTNAHIGLLMGQDSPSFIRSSANAGTPGFFDQTTFFGEFPQHRRSQIVDEAYVTIANFDRSPFYLRAGREYVPFGDYTRYAMTNMVQSVTELMSATQATAVEAGFADASGFNGSIYGFRGDEYHHDPVIDRTKTENYGANLAYSGSDHDMSYKIGVGYIHNMTDVKHIASVMPSNTPFETANHKDIPGYAVDAKLRVGDFDISGDYVAATKNFDGSDLVADVFDALAEPKAWSADAGYHFQTMGRDSRIGIGYQGTQDAMFLGLATGSLTGLGLPEDRYLANYVVSLSKCVDLGFEAVHDKAYKSEFVVQNEITEFVRLGHDVNYGIMRIGFKFS